MKTLFFLLAFLMVGLLAAGSGWSHGVEGYIEQTPGYCVTAQYDDGEPMSYAAVQIKAPDSDTAFQTGRIDRNGRFMLYPDQPGQWQVVVQDGMGHRLALDLTVAADKAAPQAEKTPAPMTRSGSSRAGKIIAGLGVIFGMFGLIYGWSARRAVGSATRTG
jgi:nickel transport protein